MHWQCGRWTDIIVPVLYSPVPFSIKSLRRNDRNKSKKRKRIDAIDRTSPLNHRVREFSTINSEE